MKGKILLKDYKIHCVIGCNPLEREAEQELSLDIEVLINLTPCVLNDSITETVNYEKIPLVLRALAHSRKYHLIETFAYESIHALLSAFPEVEWAKVSVKKKGALPLASYAMFEVEKSRNEESV